MTIKFFGILKELVGQEIKDIPYCSSVISLRTYLNEHIPQIKNQPFALAVNRELLHEDRTLQPDDEIACLPPFSGG